jgi:hypothetical protein
MSFRRDARIVVGELERYSRDSRAARKPVIDQRPLAGIVRELGLDELASRGGLSGKPLGRFVRAYLERTIRLHHPT